MANSNPRYETRVVYDPEKGSSRRIYIPSEGLAREQADVLAMARHAGIERFMPHAHGGIRGRSQLTNAQAHIDGKEFYKLDLWRAYPSVQPDHLKMMATVAFTHLTETTGWGTVDNIVDTTVMTPDVKGLPTGFATSPLFFNIYCMSLDVQLAALSAENGLTYTRFADDLTFSGPRHAFASKALRRKIRTKIAEQPGGSIRDSKARIETIHKGVTVTGITITSDLDYIHPAKELLNASEDHITLCEEKLSRGERLSLNDLDRLNGYNGVLNMAGSAEDSKSKYVRDLFERYQVLMARR